MASFYHAFASGGRDYYTGLSTDIKPAGATPMSVAIETDTGECYVATGSGWKPAGNVANVLSGHVSSASKEGIVYAFGASQIANATNVSTVGLLNISADTVLEVIALTVGGYGADVTVRFGATTGAPFNLFGGTNVSDGSTSTIGRIGVNASSPSQPNGGVLALVSTDALIPTIISLPEPIRIPPGGNIVVTPTVVNNKSFFSAMWREVPQ